MRIGLLHIGQPLSMDATVSAHVAQKLLSCLLIVSNINGSPYSRAVLHFLVLHFQRLPFFDAEYLINSTTYRHSFNEILIGTYTRLTQLTMSFLITLSDLE